MVRGAQHKRQGALARRERRVRALVRLQKQLRYANDRAAMQGTLSPIQLRDAVHYAADLGRQVATLTAIVNGGAV